MKAKNIRVVLYACDRCGEQFLLPLPEYYYRAGTFELSVQREPAWCHDEATVVEAEVLPPLEELDELLIYLEAQSAMQQHFDAEDEDESGLDLKTWRHRKSFIAQRHTPPRCLECGSERIDYLSTSSGDPGAVQHPGCGGIIKMKNMELAPSERPVRYYSFDGEAVGTDTP